MNLGEIIESLTIDKKVINEYYEREYQHAEFKIKSTDIFAEDVVKYFNDEMHSGKSLGFIKTEEDFRIRHFFRF